MPPARARILVVDDDATARAILRSALASEATLRECQSAEEALATLRNETFDVIVTDHLMGFMQGADLLEIVAREHPRIRRIMVTAYTDLEPALERKGIAHAFLRKPFDVSAARKTILGV